MPHSFLSNITYSFFFFLLLLSFSSHFYSSLFLLTFTPLFFFSLLLLSFSSLFFFFFYINNSKNKFKMVTILFGILTSIIKQHAIHCKRNSMFIMWDIMLTSKIYIYVVLCSLLFKVQLFVFEMPLFSPFADEARL